MLFQIAHLGWGIDQSTLLDSKSHAQIKLAVSDNTTSLTQSRSNPQATRHSTQVGDNNGGTVEEKPGLSYFLCLQKPSISRWLSYRIFLHRFSFFLQSHCYLEYEFVKSPLSRSTNLPQTSVRGANLSSPSRSSPSHRIIIIPRRRAG